MRGIFVCLTISTLFLTTACTPKLFSTKIAVECTVEAPSTTDENKPDPSGLEEATPISQENFPVPGARTKKKKTSRAINPDQENSKVPSEAPVRAISQDTDVWCWAASAQTIMASHGRDTPQCEMVNAIYAGGQQAADGRPLCCNDPNHTPCQQNGWPHQVFNEFNFEWKYVRGPLSPQNVEKQIDGNGPFIFVLLYAGGGGHSFVVKDYRESMVNFS